MEKLKDKEISGYSLINWLTTIEELLYNDKPMEAHRELNLMIYQLNSSSKPEAK